MPQTVDFNVIRDKIGQGLRIFVGKMEVGFELANGGNLFELIQNRLSFKNPKP